MVAQGYNYTEIADELHLTPSAIRDRVYHLRKDFALPLVQSGTVIPPRGYTLQYLGPTEGGRVVVSRNLTLGLGGGAAGLLLTSSPTLFAVATVLAIVSVAVTSVATALLPQGSGDRLKFWTDRRRHQRASHTAPTSALLMLRLPPAPIPHDQRRFISWLYREDPRHASVLARSGAAGAGDAGFVVAR